MLNYFRSDGWVKTTQGPAVPGAQVYICTQPANVTPPTTPPRTTPVPWIGPNPQASIFSDAGLTPIVQPIITDGFGHYDFYVQPGVYTVVILFGGKVQQVYIDQSIGNVGSTGGTSLTLEVNGSPLFNQTLFNLQQGSGIILTPDNFGNVTIATTGGVGSLTLETNGVTNGSQTLLNLFSGSNVTLTDNGLGKVTIASSTVAVQINGSAFSSTTLLDFINTPTVSWTDAGGGHISASANPNSVLTAKVEFTATELMAGGNQFKTIVPSQPSGIIPIVLFTSYVLHAGSIPFNFGGLIQNVSAGNGDFNWSDASITGIDWTNSVDQFGFCMPIDTNTHATNSLSLLNNKPITVQFGSGNLTLGNGSATVSIVYFLLDTN